LLQRGAQLLGPASGEQACGEVGTGRMVEPAEIVTAVIGSFTPGALTGVKVVVTAGPTREALDPVRYISNRSSGKMGFAVAAAAARAGATVTLIAGPVSLATPAGVVRIDVVTAEEMYAAVLAAQTACDILIAAAAVADYRAKTVVPQKIKKSGASLTLELVPNRDILASITAQSPRPFVVGFAAETERLLENARLKLERKALDVVAANSVVNAASGFEVDHNALTVLWPDGSAELPLMHKTLLAERLIELIVERYRAKSRS
ncbi:MAG: phosphopantothenoylcysteine decarboxylase/phosphopantothenate--cysteine ligase, partial [Halothiobacillaceae bacterium]